MSKTNPSPTPDTRIRMESLSIEDSFSIEESLSIDKMRLNVANIYPSFQKKSEQEARREIAARLYQIFKKYA